MTYQDESVSEMGLYKNRIVVKVGTSTLTHETGESNLRRFDRLARVLSDIQNMGYEVILVSSGAIAVGNNKLRMQNHPACMSLKQAAAAVGQCSLMYWYGKFFSEYDKTIAQILLNAEDIEDEEKKENLTNTFDALLKLGIIPVVNENDSVSYTEIESEDKLFGDNDMLSSVVAVLCRAHKLVILSDIDGFYDSEPRFHPNAKLIEKITQIDDAVQALAGGSGSRRGTGGMKTKLQAAKLATAQGIDTVIANGKDPDALYEIIKGIGGRHSFCWQTIKIKMSKTYLKDIFRSYRVKLLGIWFTWDYRRYNRAGKEPPSQLWLSVP